MKEGYGLFENTANKAELKAKIDKILSENPFGINAIISDGNFCDRKLIKFTDGHYLAENLNDSEDRKFIDEKWAKNEWQDYNKKQILNNIDIGGFFFKQQNCILLSQWENPDKIDFRVISKMKSFHTGIFNTFADEKHLSYYDNHTKNTQQQYGKYLELKFKVWGGGGFFELTDDGDYLIRLYNFDPNNYTPTNVSLEDRLKNSFELLIKNINKIIGDNQLFYNKRNNFFYFGDQAMNIGEYQRDEKHDYEIRIGFGTLMPNNKYFFESGNYTSNPKAKEPTTFEFLRERLFIYYSRGSEYLKKEVKFFDEK
jgi:hypothetical protein